MTTFEIPQKLFSLKQTFFYQLLLGCFLAAGIFYFKGSFPSFFTGFILGQLYAIFTFWLIIQLFKRKNRGLVFGAFMIKWGVLACILYIFLQKVSAPSFIIGLSGFVSFWFFLALEDRRKKAVP